MFIEPKDFCDHYHDAHFKLTSDLYRNKPNMQHRFNVIKNRAVINSTFLENRKNKLKLISLLKAISSNCDYETWRNMIWAIESLNWLSSYEYQYIWSASHPNRFDLRALNKLIESYKPGHFTIGTIIRLAKMNGWSEQKWEAEYANQKIVDDEFANPASNFTILIGDLDEELGRDKLQTKNDLPLNKAVNLYELQNSSANEDDYEKIALLTPEQLSSITSSEYIIKNILYENSISAIYGPSMSGKSFLVIDMLACIATGIPWNGHKVKKVPITYLALEGKSGVTNRISAWCKKNNLGTLPNFRVMIDSIDITDGNQLNNLISSLISHNQTNGILVIDTLNQSAPDIDENSSKDMGKILRALKKLQKATNCHILIVHHTGKDPSKGLRGHSSLLAALDSAIEIKKNLNGRSWEISKSKDGKADLQGFFNLEIIELGVDKDGDKITSCAICSNLPNNRIFKKIEPKGVHQKIALNVINEIFQKIPSSAPKRISIDEAITAVGNRLVVDNKRRGERSKAAINGLVASGLIQLSNDHLTE
jgi:hypothetical protein